MNMSKRSKPTKDLLLCPSLITLQYYVLLVRFVTEFLIYLALLLNKKILNIKRRRHTDLYLVTAL